MMENDLLTQVLYLYKEDNWRDILKLNINSDNVAALKLLWVWPNQKNLRFLKKIFDKNSIKGIISLGCGCGLLEWIIMRATDIPVVGYEVNIKWWQSKYSNPTFIPLQFFENDQCVSDKELNSEFALLFCYFNDEKAFQNYIRHYKGKFVIIIGPSEGSGRHTNPLPFSPNFGIKAQNKWKLLESEEIKNTKDFIAIYKCVANDYNL